MWQRAAAAGRGPGLSGNVPSPAPSPIFDEVWDVHTHSTPAPDTFAALARFSHYETFVRVQSQDAASGCAAAIVSHRGEVQRRLQANAYEIASRLEECDANGVTMQVISPTPMMLPDAIDSEHDAAEICRILNDGNAAMVAEYPARFTALGIVPMQFADAAIAELRRVATLGMRGIMVNSHVDGRDLDALEFFAIFEAAAQLDLAVFVHPWGGFMSPAEPHLQRRMHAARNWRPWLLAMGLETALAFDSMHCGEVHARLPHLRVMYAHGGGCFPAMLGRLAHGAHTRPDLFCNNRSANPYETLRDCAVYADSLTHDPWSLDLLLRQLGAQRVAMGSDYPYPLGELDPSGDKKIYPGHMLRHLPESNDDAAMQHAWQHFPWLPPANSAGPRDLPVIKREQKHQVLHRTAKEWLRWK